jgi:hypothetical protein
LSGAGNLARFAGMGRGYHKYRVTGAALALLGVAFYALILPWHLTSQFSTQLHHADVAAGIICSSDGSSPAMPATSCPICKGLASFQLALATSDMAALPVQPHAVAVLDIVRDDVAELYAPHPNSRGPPLLSA